MLYFLPAPILGVLTISLLVTNLALWSIPFFTFTLSKLIVPLHGGEGSIRECCPELPNCGRAATISFWH